MEGSKKVGLWRNDFKASQPETDPSLFAHAFHSDTSPTQGENIMQIVKFPEKRMTRVAGLGDTQEIALDVDMNGGSANLNRPQSETSVGERKNSAKGVEGSKQIGFRSLPA